MRLVGLLSLVALVFLLSFSFRSLLHHQQAVVVGEGAAAERGGGRRHDRNRHSEEWAEERKRMRWFMTRDYARARRHTPMNNRLDP
ncbi:hypothetical protein BS78_04G184300 [Paspalum vaginatum]|nr:hypothetical protein BS78_04G184300 [Paspalum vaginatum]